MSRAVPYVAKPTEALLQRFSEAADARIYVVQEPGPTSFVLKSADSERKHRVSIGSVHSCSCGAREQPCVHTSFVLLRIFRLPAGDQRAWQGGLLDSELERIIEERARTTAARRQQQRMAAAPVATASGGGGGAPRPGEVAQREIDDANKEPCPICYEDISCEDQQAGKLEWCRLGCLNPDPDPESNPNPKPIPNQVPPRLRQECAPRVHDRVERPPGVDRQEAHLPPLPE